MIKARGVSEQFLKAHQHN